MVSEGPATLSQPEAGAGPPGRPQSATDLAQADPGPGTEVPQAPGQRAVRRRAGPGHRHGHRVDGPGERPGPGPGAGAALRLGGAAAVRRRPRQCSAAAGRRASLSAARLRVESAWHTAAAALAAPAQLEFQCAKPPFPGRPSS